MKKLKNKIAATAGETIAEVLVASLIAGLGLLLLASLITASKNMIIKSEKTMETYYDAVSRIEESDSGSQETETMTISYLSTPSNQTTSITVQVYSDTDSGLKAYKIS